MNREILMKVTARNAAFDALNQVSKNDGYSNIVLDKTLKAYSEKGLSQRDCALASIIFYGVLEKRITLDYYIERFLKDPSKKLNAHVQTLVRMGAYQIMFLDRVPDSAAVNETVTMLKENGREGQAPFVNGVLRSMVRSKESLKLPRGDSLRDMSVYYSIPEEIISLWKRSYSSQVTKNLLESLCEPIPLYIRLNSKREIEGFKYEMVEGVPDAAKIVCPGSPASLPQYGAGLFHVQDLSAQLICHILAPRAGETVWDVCAAPGGKSFTIAQMMEDEGSITACDIYKGRVNLIRQGSKRLGISIINAIMNDALKGFPEEGVADKVLCDVPCSGYGVMRRKPEIRYKSLNDIADLPEMQYNILAKASKLVKAGGILVYSTCTLNPGENENVAKRFLENFPSFEPYPVKLPLEIDKKIQEAENMLTLFPFYTNSDGFFVAVFKLRGK